MAGKPARLERLLDLDPLLAGDDPWWARTSSSPASSLSLLANRSASRRELQKMIVEWCSRMSSRIRGWIAGQMLVRASGPAAGRRLLLRRSSSPSLLMSSTGTRPTARGPYANRHRRCGRRATPLPCRVRRHPEAGDRPDRRWVAESPIRWGGASQLLQPLQAEGEVGSALGPARAWISSTMTCSTPRRISAAWLVRIRYSDSAW